MEGTNGVSDWKCLKNGSNTKAMLMKELILQGVSGSATLLHCFNGKIGRNLGLFNIFLYTIVNV